MAVVPAAVGGPAAVLVAPEAGEDCLAGAAGPLAGGGPPGGVRPTGAGKGPGMVGAGFAWDGGPAASGWGEGWSGDPGDGKLRLKPSPNGVPVQPVCSNNKTMAVAMVAGARHGIGISYLRA
jgi:hypothetical protein